MYTHAQTYTYTARRSAYLSTIITFTFMLLAEGGAIGLIAAQFIHDARFKLLPAGLVAALLLYFSFVVLAPLRTKHGLTDTHLLLHYGRALNIQVPRTTIASTQAVHERLSMLQPLQATHDAQKERITATFSDHGQILLRLAQPHTYKVGRTHVSVREILMNIDKRDAFLEELQEKPELASEDKEQKYRDKTQEQGGQGRGKPYPYYTTAPHAPTLALQTRNLSRSFQAFKAVDGLHLSIAQGEIYGFLGSNGAGKTTTLKMLVGLLEPSAGQVWIAGHDVWAEPLAAKAAFGYVADRAILYERLTGREFLHFLGQIRGIPLAEAEQRIEHFLAMFELMEHADRPCGGYSLGMKRKLSLAGALLHQPRVLLLDEPLNGLDPRSARRLKDLFIELAAADVSVLLSTHDLATAEEVCHRVGIIHKGRLLVEGSASELEQMAAAPDLETVFLNLTAEELEEVRV